MHRIIWCKASALMLASLSRIYTNHCLRANCCPYAGYRKLRRLSYYVDNRTKIWYLIKNIHLLMKIPGNLCQWLSNKCGITWNQTAYGSYYTRNLPDHDYSSAAPPETVSLTNCDSHLSSVPATIMHHPRWILRWICLPQLVILLHQECRRLR